MGPQRRRCGWWLWCLGQHCVHGLDIQPRLAKCTVILERLFSKSEIQCFFLLPTTYPVGSYSITMNVPFGIYVTVSTFIRKWLVKYLCTLDGMINFCVLQLTLMGFTCLCLDIESPDVCRLDDCIELYQSHPDKSITRTHARAQTK